MNRPAIKIAFRVDASLQIGTGHVMRCLTLANALKQQGYECHFICREHPGNLIGHIHSQGFEIHTLALTSAAPELMVLNDSTLAHAAWLGATQSQDAAECTPILGELKPDWLIVDHYAIDAHWEILLAEHYRKLMVIDDLADRSHLCDLLLDQTFGRDVTDYIPWTPEDCTLLCGSKYALLRPEFAVLRELSLKRRNNPQLLQLLITMGGVDKDNVTSKILMSLEDSNLPTDCRIIVVMGATAPWLLEVQQKAKALPWNTEVRINVSNMAKLMTESDLAIGAAGATSWERCCLGLPTIMLVLADNQRKIAQALSTAGAAYPVETTSLMCNPVITKQRIEPRSLSVMSTSCAAIADGLGTTRVASHIKI